MSLSLLPVIWADIIGFCILMYVILDGFTLGTGMLMPWLDEHERDQAISVILPNWDGNQTWLVLGGACLYGAFPQAFGILLPLLYLPLLLMVLALLFRGVAFEFRLKSLRGKGAWDWCFIIGSVVATFVQGVILGAFIQGFDYPSMGELPSFIWLSPYTVFTGVALVFGYALLGATRLILKTEGSIGPKMQRIAKRLALLIILFALVVSIWTPFMAPSIFINWFQPGRTWLLVLMPTLTFFIWLWLMLALHKGKEHAPFWASILIFCCCFTGFAIGVWPDIVPHHMSIWAAASPPGSLIFMLVGAVIMIPVLLIYTGYSYRIFGGKVRDLIQY
jgi:cytochrome bd ubiquinol oxidase subunit II